MKEMTPKERLLAAIRFRCPDRVPVCPRMWRYMLRHDGSQSTGTYLKYVERVGLDPILTAGAGSPMLIPPPLSHYENDGDVEVIAEYLIKEPEDLDALRYIASAFKKKREDVPDFKKLSTEIRGRALVSLRTLSALSHNAGDVYRIEDMMTSCLGNPTFVHELIDVFHQPFIDITRMALEHGAEVIYCSAFYESIGSGWSPSTHRKFFLPRIKEHVELSHSYGAVYHLYDDGKVRETLPMMKDIGVDLISTVCPRPAGKWGRYTEVND